MSETAYDDRNVFAKILRGEIPSQKVYEDDDCIAIMDVMPQSPGHVLVLPRAASRNILDIEEKDLKSAIVVVQRLARAVKQAFAADGLLINQFNEEASGQTVFHTHFHIIPRFEGVAMKKHTGQMEDSAVLSEQAQKIRAALAETG
jgi:histidine triad (HIT) family protein